MSIILGNRSFRYFLFLILVHHFTFAIPKPEEKKDRVVEKVLSDGEQYQDEEHVKKRLGLIVDKIDKNEDGQVTYEELKDWIRLKHMSAHLNMLWKMVDGKEKITWDSYLRASVYGFILHDCQKKKVDKGNAGRYSFEAMLDRAKRRWSFADVDGDEALTHDEFAAFVFPETRNYMKDVLILDIMEYVDKDKDGKISLDEHIASDIHHNSADEDEEPPEWVRNEKEQFFNYRDKNGDGFLDTEEAMLPRRFEYAEAEARRLIYETDSDADQKLTKEEILNKYDLFVRLQATEAVDFVEALISHDEF